MRIAIISDIHFGNAECSLSNADGSLNEITFKKFTDAVFKLSGSHKLDYLVLNGDILDFAVCSFQKSIKNARYFFEAIEKSELCTDIIYNPGNHDKFIWDSYEWEQTIINQMKNQEDPLPFKRNAPGFIDMTKENSILEVYKPDDSNGCNWLKIASDQNSQLGDIFLKGLLPKGSKMKMNLVYPNLFLNTEQGTIFVTHGQFLQTMWQLISEIISGYKDKKIKINETLNLQEIEAFNYPITQLVGSSLGQAEAVTNLAQAIQNEVEDHDKYSVTRTVNHVAPRLFNLYNKNWFIKIIYRLFQNFITREIISFIVGTNDNSSKKYLQSLNNIDVMSRFRRFYDASVDQMQRIKPSFKNPEHFIFGHTHEAHPTPFIPKSNSILPENLKLYNSGGWLENSNKSKVKSAVVFYIDSSGKIEHEMI
ncbi:MAG: metallophosphoesterase [Candidatus Kapabacteria bacterium]|nr:metallophosphoesterase [Candidatus Kapabacteria bacterium]